MANTYYDILGVSASASQDDVKRAYRKMAMQSHPDLDKSSDAKARFILVTEAYEILGDAHKRRVYNQQLRDRAAMEAGRSYAQSQARRKNANTSQNSQARNAYPQDEAFQAWVRKAQAAANAQARMNYQDFKNSRFSKTEASVFLYLQFLIMGAMFLFGIFLVTAPFVMMFRINWMFVFSGIVLVPVAFEIFRQASIGVREIRKSL